MADGTYERRGPREAELARLKRILAEQQAKSRMTPPQQLDAKISLSSDRDGNA